MKTFIKQMNAGIYLLLPLLCELSFQICHLPQTTAIEPNDFATWWNDIEQVSTIV
jgi:hypothetical protein